MFEMMKEVVRLQGTSGQLDKCEKENAKLMQKIEPQTGARAYAWSHYALSALSAGHTRGSASGPAKS